MNQKVSTMEPDDDFDLPAYLNSEAMEENILNEF